MHALTRDSVTIAYRFKPGLSGRCVVFVNSLGSSQALWDPVIDLLGPSVPTVTCDLRGHGLSDCADTYTIHDLADDVIHVIETLALTDVVLCGVSIGGMIAQSVAARRPDLLNSVILSNTGLRVGTTDRWNARIQAVRDSGIVGIADTILDNWFSPGFQAAHPDLHAVYRNMLCRTPAAGYITTCEVLRDTDLSQLTPKITVPTVCIAGSDDQSTPPALVKQLAESIHEARYICLENVGHLPSLEAPEKISAILQEMRVTESPTP